MDAEIAEDIYERAQAFDPVLTSLLQSIDALEDEGLRQRFTKAAADVMGLVFREILHPLEQRYPDLIPVREK